MADEDISIANALVGFRCDPSGMSTREHAVVRAYKFDVLAATFRFYALMPEPRTREAAVNALSKWVSRLEGPGTGQIAARDVEHSRRDAAKSGVAASTRGVAASTRYSYHFTGFVRRDELSPHHVVGVGTLVLNPDNTLSGEHRSSRIPLMMSELALKTRSAGFRFAHNPYRLAGTYDLTAGTMEVKFYLKDSDGTEELRVIGDFAFVYEGAEMKPTRLMVISSRTQVIENGVPADIDEVVSAEANLVA
jgi:hypothetical protein